jgi:Tfp pilus assembly protein PilO
MSKTTLKPFKVTNIVFLLSIVFLLVSISAYVYSFNVVKSKGESTASLQKETTAFEAQEAEVGQLRTNLVTTEADRNKITSYFIDADNIVTFLETVEGYAKTVGLKVSFENVSFAKSPDRLDVSLKVDGSFTNLYRFTSLVESAPYEITFNNMNITKSQLDVVPVKKGDPIIPPWNERISLSVLSITGVAKHLQ